LKLKNNLHTVIFLLVYVIFIILTIIGFNEFWPSTLQDGNFTYSVIFVCFLETLAFGLLIFESMGYFDRFVSTRNLFLVIGSLLSGYIILSIIIIFIGNILYLVFPSLLYITTIGFTFLFLFIVTWYVNRIIGDKNIDEFDRNGRQSRISLISLFDNLILNISSNSTIIKHVLYSDIQLQLEIISRKIKTSSLPKLDDNTKEFDEAILKNIEIINYKLNTEAEQNDATEVVEKILTQLKLIRENLSHREAVTKI